MSYKIGIPRALLYYHYYPMWRTFFEEMGAEVILSPPSTKGLLATGLKYAVDEVCLPVKLAFGHVLELAGKVDFIFLPRVISVKKKEYICPKFLGLPDMVRCLKDIPPLIDVSINLYKKKKAAFNSAKEVGRIFSAGQIKIWLAFRRSVHIQKTYFRLLNRGYMPQEALSALSDETKSRHISSTEEHSDINVALIGHPYNIYDDYTSMNMIGRLRHMGARVLTADNVPYKTVRRNAATLPKKLFWTLGQQMAGAAFHYLGRPEIDGMIHVAAFGCGPDSMIGELIERYARDSGMPFLNLTLDEHTGEAGIVTRLEAFLDMVRWRKTGKAWA